MEKVFGNGYAYITILKSVFPDRQIRDVCTDAVNDLNKIMIEVK